MRRLWRMKQGAGLRPLMRLQLHGAWLQLLLPLYVRKKGLRPLAAFQVRGGVLLPLRIRLRMQGPVRGLLAFG